MTSAETKRPPVTVAVTLVEKSINPTNGTPAIGNRMLSPNSTAPNFNRQPSGFGGFIKAPYANQLIHRMVAGDMLPCRPLFVPIKITAALPDSRAA
jgi:hypothetical protein